MLRHSLKQRTTRASAMYICGMWWSELGKDSRESTILSDRNLFLSSDVIGREARTCKHVALGMPTRYFDKLQKASIWSEVQ